MTSELRIKIAESLGLDEYLIVKRGLYYRPNAVGYTSSIAEAWKLPQAEAKKYEMYADRDDVPGCEKVLLQKAPPPDFFGDANAALQLVEALKREGWSAHLDNMNDSLWECDFMRNREFYSASAPALPEAICLAYCAVKSIQTDK